MRMYKTPFYDQNDATYAAIYLGDTLVNLTTGERYKVVYDFDFAESLESVDTHIREKLTQTAMRYYTVKERIEEGEE